MTDDAPRSAADPRPNGEPYYIDSECPDCETDLVLYDEHFGNDDVWHDEWWCPDCEDGIHMDWPEGRFEHLEERMKVEAISLDELSEELAESTDSTKEEIEEGAEDIDIEPPWEADVEDSGPDGP